MVYTELDVFKKWVTSKNTIDRLGIRILALQDAKSKQCNKDMLKLFYKVWSGLTKFIRSQVTQQRWVYFSLLGSFSSISNFEGTNTTNDKEDYWFVPDIKFLDRGKFKFSDDRNNKNPYSDVKKAKINVSPSSIAQVCNTNSEAVSYILKDTIQKAISLSKDGISSRLNMKVGFLNIYQNKILFEPIKSAYNDNAPSAMNKLIGRRTNKSIGGGSKLMNLSMRSSVRTPGSVTSMYTGKSKFIHASNPNPQIGANLYPKVNSTMYNSFMGRDPNATAREKSVKNSTKLPFPFMSGMFVHHQYSKPGKRVFFEKRTDNKEVLSHQLKQISYKEQKKINDQENAKFQDNELLYNIKQNINKEEVKKKQFNDMFKLKYKNYNDNKRIENENIMKLRIEHKNQEKYNFFPYTHGDEIEKKRIDQKNLLTNEVREKYSRVGSHSQSRKQGLNSTFTNGMHMMNGGSSPIHSSPSSDFMGMKSFNGKVPVKFVTGYPAFLTPHKHYPYRRLNDTHIENTMQSAVKR